MNLKGRLAIAPVTRCAMVLTGLIFVSASLPAAEHPAAPEGTRKPEQDSSSQAASCETSTLGSPYIPVDSWIYPALLRLYSLGYIDNVYLGMRPWTRASVSNMLEDIDAQIEDANAYGVSTAGEAQQIYSALSRYLHYDVAIHCLTDPSSARVESAYSVARAISGTPLRDSYHLGSTIVNDYGRPYENGINSYSGVSGYASAGRFAFYVRGEFQAGPSAAGYSQTLAQVLSNGDETTYTDPNTQVTNYFLPQATVPMGIATTTNGRIIEAYVSAHVLNHEISFGKQDDWLGPGLGGGMAYSNNAENIYSFRINRIEPLYVPLLSTILGHFRYDFMVGSLSGHTYMPNPAFLDNPSTSLPNVINPGNPWVHVEKVSFKPTRDLEFGFERTVIWGGEGHEPITLHTFLRSFFSFDAVTPTVKYTAQDPGARFGAFDFTYRLPFAPNWLTLYSDSEAHDAVSPLFKPLHGCFRPGLYLSHVPGIPKLDLRVEAVDTDSSYPSSIGGRYQYWEIIQKQGYTNQGQLFGDWIGREDKGGQGWITYHLSGNEWLQLSLRNQKAAKDFIPGGTTLNDIGIKAVKRIGRDFEIDGSFTHERWKAPIYLPGQQNVTTTEIHLTWFPNRKISF